jgi:prepilin-type N-terminal cleavage/methylation domain-containing protein
MKAYRLRAPSSSRSRAFTLLEMIIVLAITAMMISAVYTIVQGTLTLADDVHRAEARDTRRHAFASFCESLFNSLPASAVLNLKTTQSGGQYLSELELQNVSSPFDGMPNCLVRLFTQSVAGGGMRLMLSSQAMPNPNDVLKSTKVKVTTVALFDELFQCQWRLYIPSTQQWVTIWAEENNTTTPIIFQHPPLLELVMEQPGEISQRQVFWIAPAQPLNLVQPAAVPAGTPAAAANGQINVQAPTPPTGQTAPR